METRQLLDALTDHMAIYHCRKRQIESPHPSSSSKSDRHKVLEWLARLTIKERQIALTIVDESWVALLLQMQRSLDREGPGSFFVLPDFPSAAKNGHRNGSSSCRTSSSSSSSLVLPGLCFRKARGLIRRLSSSGQVLAANVRLYSSRDGDRDGVGAGVRVGVGARSPRLDSVTISSDLLENLEQLVDVLDEISYGQFLDCQCFSNGSSWDETPWLKRMGYYSLTAFVANRLEISIWSAWITALGTKQPSKTVSRSVARCSFEIAGTASKICTRRQGFELWWNALDAENKRELCDVALARLSSIDEVLDSQEQSFRDDKKFAKICSGIQFIAELKWNLRDRIVYCSLQDAHSNSEAALQILRNLLMKVMTASMEYDLLDQGNNDCDSRINGNPKRLQVKGRKSKPKKPKKNSSSALRKPEEQTAEMDRRIGDAAKEIASIQIGDQCPDSGWVPGRRKKRNKKPRRDACSSSENTIRAGNQDTNHVEAIVSNRSAECSTAAAAADATPDATKAVDAVHQEIETSEPSICDSARHADVQLSNPPTFIISSSHEWPGAPRSRLPDCSSPGWPLATDWLHLDAIRSKPPLIVFPPRQPDSRGLLSKPVSFSWDWPPMVQPGFGIASPVGYTALPNEQLPTFVSAPIPPAAEAIGDDTDREDLHDSDDPMYRTSEGEADPTQFFDPDYNQFFGGGVMYWNSADYTGLGYSRPGSHSSEDSSWARREADLTVVVDDIVGLPAVAAPYSGLSSGPSCTSPSSGCSIPLDQFVEAQKVDAVILSEHTLPPPPPALPPIAVREPKNTKVDCTKQARSPHEPRGRRDSLRWKRSPSPVLRCVPPAPPPPPPSPVAGVRKRRGFPTVRSGSSSPRHWGVFNWPDNQMKSVCPEGILPTNGLRRCFPTAAMHPLLRERLLAIPPRSVEQEHPDLAFPMQTTLLHKKYPAMTAAMAKLHKEIEAFSLQVAAENARRKPFINVAVKKVTHALQVLWPRSRTKIFGSNATGLALPNSDVDLVVCLPPVRNLEPIKEAGILEGRNGIKETSLQHAARYLADQDWVKSDSLKTIENTTIPIIMMVAECFPDNVYASDSEASGHYWGTKEDRHLVRLDISFETPLHTGLLTAELVKELVSQFPAISPLALVLKQFLMDRGLDHPYTGGLSSYCLVLLITRFLQHQNHLGRPCQTQSLGSLLLDFLHFYGCVFDPRRMCISIRGGGMYVSRDRVHGIDPLHIEDPLHLMNNVGRNCFRILQCTKALGDAYLTLERELECCSTESSLLSKILLSLPA